MIQNYDRYVSLTMWDYWKLKTEEKRDFVLFVYVSFLFVLFLKDDPIQTFGIFCYWTCFEDDLQDIEINRMRVYVFVYFNCMSKPLTRCIVINFTDLTYSIIFNLIICKYNPLSHQHTFKLLPLIYSME